jgi:hypothetical protein
MGSPVGKASGVSRSRGAVLMPGDAVQLLAALRDVELWCRQDLGCWYGDAGERCLSMRRANGYR